MMKVWWKEVSETWKSVIGRATYVCIKWSWMLLSLTSSYCWSNSTGSLGLHQVLVDSLVISRIHIWSLIMYARRCQNFLYNIHSMEKEIASAVTYLLCSGCRQNKRYRSCSLTNNIIVLWVWFNCGTIACSYYGAFVRNQFVAYSYTWTYSCWSN